MAVDDWFESASNASESRQLSPWTPDDATPLPITFRRNLFQPINDTVQRQSPVRSTIVADDETKMKRLTSPRISESGIFGRSPEPKIRRPSSSSSRSITSPATKTTLTSPQLTKTITQPSPPRSIPPSTNDQRMSGWTVREHSPDGSDGN